jgi:hypothetical protein
MNVKSIREDKENFNKTTYKYSIPLQVKRRISAIDSGLEFFLEKVYTIPKICDLYVSYDEFIQVMSDTIAERMYNYHFSDLDDMSEEWEEIYHGILEYVDIVWGDRLEEYFENGCNKGEVIKEEKINNFIISKFDRVFDKLNLKIENHRNTIYGKWFNEMNKVVFHRNDWGTLWIEDCETYRELRSYTKFIGLDLEGFNELLIKYLNDKYQEQFFDRPIKKVGDENNCLEEY